MKKCFILLLFSIGVFALQAQVLSIKEKTTNEPILYATIFCNTSNRSAITDINGQVDISEFKNSKSITIQSIAHQNVIISYVELEAFNFVLLMETNNFDLDEIVVTATRWRQSSHNIPSPISTISAKEIALQNPQTAADLLLLSGKVFIQKSQQGGGSPMIRGFATNRLLYTVDGVRMNNAIFRGGNIQNVINLDPFAMESTEVLFGSGSVIYGSDAIGGVMSFQTLQPKLSIEKTEVSGKVTARYSTANKEKTAHFDINVGGKKWAAVTSISRWDYDHLRQGSHGPKDYMKDYFVESISNTDHIFQQDDPLLQIPTAYSQFNMMQKIRFRPNEKWDFNYGFHYSETSPYGRYDRNNRTRNELPRYAQWDYGPQSWMMNNFNIIHTKKNLLYDEWSLLLAHQGFEESRIARNFNSYIQTNNEEKVLAWSANFDFTKTLNSKHKLFYGLEYINNDVQSTGWTKDVTTEIINNSAARYPNATWFSLAAYLHHEYQFSTKTHLQAGLRYNQYRLDADFSNNLDFHPFPFQEALINDGALTANVGMVFRPNDNWVFSTNLATAFRSPNVDDIGKIFDSEPSAVTIPNPNLKAEYAYTFDIGMAKTFENIAKLDVSAYYTLLQNAIVRRNYQLNGQDSIFYDGALSQIQALQNAATATVYGYQASIEFRLAKNLNLNTDLNYQIGHEELDDGSISPSRHAAPFFGVSRLKYSSEKFQLTLYAHYQTERQHKDMPLDEIAKTEIYAKDENGKTYAPAWYTINIKGSYDITPKFNINLGLENITDQRYRPYSSGLSGAGRNFVFSLRYGI